MARKRRGRGKGGAGGSQAPTLPLAQAQPRGAGGRTTKCTPELTERIADYVREGMGREAAALRAGIGATTFHRWMADGVEQEPADPKMAPYREFRERILKASIELQEEVSGVILRGVRSKNERVATENARWLAERLWPDVYGKRVEQRQTGPDGGAVKHEHKVEAKVESVIPPAELARMTIEQLEALGRALRGES